MGDDVHEIVTKIHMILEVPYDFVSTVKFLNYIVFISLGLDDYISSSVQIEFDKQMTQILIPCLFEISVTVYFVTLRLYLYCLESSEERKLYRQ